MDMKIFDDFLFESLHIDTKKRIRDAVHDIVVTRIDYGKEMKIPELSSILKDEYKINISEEILKTLLFKNWWLKNDYSIFQETDKTWLDVWSYRNSIEHKKRKNEKPLGKSRKKLIKKEEENKRLNINYKRSYQQPWWEKDNYGLF